MGPLVSCVMSTRGRTAFVRQAIRCFLRQDYTNKELIIVDDGDGSLHERLPDHHEVRHVWLDHPHPLGRKLNIGIAAARGGIVQKLDDDDYYHPRFLSKTVGALINAAERRGLVACRSFLVLIAATGILKHAGDGWCAGGTFCFHRDAWGPRAFSEAPSAVDFAFLRDHDPSRILLDDPELYMLVRHGEGHTWRTLGETDVTAYFAGRADYDKTLEAYLGSSEDVRFYRDLAQRAVPA